MQSKNIPTESGWAIRTHPDPVLAKYGMSITFVERFWKHVKKTDTCWIWTGSKGDGYGNISRGSDHVSGLKMIRAHVASWIIHRGEIPNGLCVLHDCPNGDNRACVNPNHLWLGTRKDNGEDASRKQVFPDRCGENNPRHKLTHEQVLAIRTDNRKTSARKLARIYGVSRSAIRFVLSHKSWS